MFDMYIDPMFLAFVPVTIAVVSVLKMYTDHYWAPLQSLAVGLLVSLFATEVTWGETVINGLVVGLMASGLFSGVKALVPESLKR